MATNSCSSNIVFRQHAVPTSPSRSYLLHLQPRNIVSKSLERTLLLLTPSHELYNYSYEFLVVVIGTGYSLKDKNKAKLDKTESGIGKSAKNQSRRYG
ncbi:hypothetical protein Tco_0565796 [Tanacetum coccineum]